MIIDIKEELYLPNEKFFDFYVTVCISTEYRYRCVIILKFVGINKEKEICLPNKEHINGTDEKV